MVFKSIITFALVAFLGRVMAAPVLDVHLNARANCTDLDSCKPVVNNPPKLARGLFDDPSSTLSTTPPVGSTPSSVGSPNDPSPTTSPYNFFSPSLAINPVSTPASSPASTPASTPVSTPVSTPFPTLSVDQSSPAPFIGSPSSSPPNPSIPVPSDGGVVTITVTSTVSSCPTESPLPPGSSSDPVGGTLPPAPSSSPVVEIVMTLTPGPPDSPEPTPSPTSSGIFFSPGTPGS